MISPLVCLLERTLTQRLQKYFCIEELLSLLLLRCLGSSGKSVWNFRELLSTKILVFGIFISTAFFLELLVDCIIILRVCKHYGYTKDQLSVLFESLIMSLLLYGLEVWCSASQGKYLDRIDNFIRQTLIRLYNQLSVLYIQYTKIYFQLNNTNSSPKNGLNLFKESRRTSPLRVCRRLRLYIYPRRPEVMVGRDREWRAYR